MNSKVKKKALEEFILAEDKKQGALKFGMHTEPYDYYLLLHDINKIHAEKKKDSYKDIEKRLDDYKKKYGVNVSYNSLIAKLLLVKIELEDKQSKKNDLIDELNEKCLHIRKDYVEKKMPELPKYTDQASVQSSDTYETEEYKPYNEIPMSFTEAVPEKQFNKEWEEYFLKNPSAMKPQYITSFSSLSKIEDLGINDYTYMFEASPSIVAKLVKRVGTPRAYNIHNHLTGSQMNELWSSFKEFRTDSEFAAVLLRKKFHRQIDQINSSKNPEKIAKNYLKIYRGFKKEFEGWFKSFSDFIIHDIEANLISQHVLYLLKAKKRDQNIIYELLERIKYRYDRSSLETFFGIKNYDKEVSLEDIAYDYAIHNIREKKWGLSECKKYWNSYKKDTSGESLYVEIKTLLGDTDDATVKKLLKENPYLAYKDTESVVLQPTIDNKPYFEPGEPVAIKMKLKNIQQLIVKVFQIDTVKYYTQNQKEIETDINLDGLVANSEKVYDFSTTSSSKLLFEDFVLDLPEGDRGVYIVDFIGNVKSCRVVIRRGSLKLVTKDSDEGTIIYILDEKNEVTAKFCKSERTGVIVGKDYYKADPATGKVLIGYRDCSGDKCILVHEGYGQFVQNVKFYRDEYQLKSDFIIPSESLIVGNLAKLAVKVVLSKNGYQVPIKEEHKLRFVLTISDQEGGKYTQNFENVMLTEFGTYEIEFKVVSSMTSIRVTTYCSVFSKNKNRDEILEVSAVKEMNGGYTESFVNMYLRENKDGYNLHLIGKNGEPKKYVKVHIQAFHQFSNGNSCPSGAQAYCQSNEQGIIKLGKLPNVARVTITCRTELRRGAKGSTATWDICNSHKSAANNILCYADSQILIPCELNSEKNLSVRSASLVEVSANGEIIENYTNKLEFEPFPNNPREGNIKLKLPKGHYRLYIKKWGLCYNIRVISTKQITVYDNDILIQGSKIIQNYRYVNTLQIESVVYSPESNVFKLQLAHVGKNVKVYAYAKHFIDNEASSHNAKFFNTMSFPSQITYALPKQTNLYLYGRELHEEYNYVLERKNAKKYMGNSLEKPTLILKRMFIQDTKTSEQKAKEGTEFKKMNISQQAIVNQQSISEKKNVATKIIPYYEFLSLPAKFYNNLTVKDGLVEIHDPELKNYSFVYFVIFDDEVVINKEFSLKEIESKIPTKDLTLKSVFGEDSGYQKRKQFNVIQKNTSFEIDDVYNCEYQMFDGLDKVFIHLRENCDSGREEFKKWEFLLRWDSFSDEQKHKWYDEFCSHEMNIFLFFKDKPYFENVIKPYLQNKMHKTLIDKFLLNEPTKDLFTFEKITTANLIELFFITLLDPSTELRKRIHKKFNIQISPLVKDDFSEFDLKRKSNIYSITRGRTMRSSEIISEKEWYYQSEWNNLNPGIVWAYLLTNVCEDNRINRESLEKHSRIPLPRFMPKGTGILETLLLLAVLDLPLRSGNTRISSNNSLGIVLQPAEDCIIYRDFFKKSPFNITNTTIVKNNIFSSIRAGNNYLSDGDPLWTDAVYQCHTVITNLTAVEQTFTFLFQIPQGSISITDNKTMKYSTVTVPAFQTRTITSPSFYFPFEGTYEHAPVFVYLDDEVVAVSERRKYTVKHEGTVKVSSKEKQKTYQRKDKIGMAKRKELLDMLKSDPILSSESEFKFDYIYHLLKDQAFYSQVIQILKRRKIYDSITYGFSIIHHDMETIPLYLDAQKSSLQLGLCFSSQLVKKDPSEDGFRYLDYYPLINQRVHKLGKSKKILNDKFKTQYTQFLKVVASKYKMDNADAMWFIYYLLLQDKIEQALEFYFKYKDNIKDDFRVQFDYLRCYMDFYLGEPRYETALQISERYKDYPVIGWRKLFENVNYKVKKALNLGAQLKVQENIHDKKEIDLNDIVMDEQNKMLRDQKFEHNIVVKGEKSLDVTVKDQEIKINCTTLEKIDVFYYPVDYEILISNDPFSQMAFEKCTFIKTGNKATFDVKGKTSLNIPIPEEYLHKTLFIQVKGDDYLQREVIFYESNIIVYVNKEEKLLQILDNKERPLPFCYVKVFYKNGNSFFFRDGFTDFRGLFRYLGKNETTSTYSNIKLFAYHEEFGIKVQEV